jgi:hypothetical protein
MKTRIVIATSFITTVIVLIIAVAVFAPASPTLAQSLPSNQMVAQAPSLADAHLALPGGGGAKVWNLLGGDFSDVSYGQQRGIAFGCLFYWPGSSTPRAIATVHLPDGATIQWLRFYWRDWVDNYNVTVELRKYFYSGSFFGYDIISPTLQSDGTNAVPKESFTEVSLNIPVDNSTNMYAVYADLEYAEDDQKLCGIQIGYIEPSIFGSALPVIQK